MLELVEVGGGMFRTLNVPSIDWFDSLKIYYSFQKIRVLFSYILMLSEPHIMMIPSLIILMPTSIAK